MLIALLVVWRDCYAGGVLSPLVVPWSSSPQQGVCFLRLHPQFTLGCRTGRITGISSKHDKLRDRGDVVSNMSSRGGQESSSAAVVMRDGVHGVTLRNVIVTGANRGLGYAIADRLLALGGYRVVLACRSQEQGLAALERLRAKQKLRNSQQHGCGTISTDFLASVHPLDVACPQSVEAFREGCVNGLLGGRVDILFNNAGVCLPEGEEAEAQDNRTAAAGVLRETLAVNFFGALGVVEACLPALVAAAPPTTVEFEKNRKDTSMEGNGMAMSKRSLRPPTVVWISSGEGELCLLGRKWRELLAEAHSLEDVTSHMSGLMASATEHVKTTAASAGPHQQEGQGRLDQREEIAFGPTPAYSLSKAAVNAAVRTWAPSLLAPAATAESSETNAGYSVGAVRLVAVCPGDVLTRMTSKEEMARGDAVSPEKAALSVVDVALSSIKEIPAGRFYRHGKEIEW